MKFNEDSRVKILTILHLSRLGYKYLSLKDETWDESSKGVKLVDFSFMKYSSIVVNCT